MLLIGPGPQKDLPRLVFGGVSIMVVGLWRGIQLRDDILVNIIDAVLENSVHHRTLLGLIAVGRDNVAQLHANGEKVAHAGDGIAVVDDGEDVVIRQRRGPLCRADPRGSKGAAEGVIDIFGGLIDILGRQDAGDGGAETVAGDQNVAAAVRIGSLLQHLIKGHTKTGEGLLVKAKICLIRRIVKSGMKAVLISDQRVGHQIDPGNGAADGDQKELLFRAVHSEFPDGGKQTADQHHGLCFLLKGSIRGVVGDALAVYRQGGAIGKAKGAHVADQIRLPAQVVPVHIVCFCCGGAKQGDQLRLINRKGLARLLIRRIFQKFWLQIGLVPSRGLGGDRAKGRKEKKRKQKRHQFFHSGRAPFP